MQCSTTKRSISKLWFMLEIECTTCSKNLYLPSSVHVYPRQQTDFLRLIYPHVQATHGSLWFESSLTRSSSYTGSPSCVLPLVLWILIFLLNSRYWPTDSLGFLWAASNLTEEDTISAKRKLCGIDTNLETNIVCISVNVQPQRSEAAIQGPNSRK